MNNIIVQKFGGTSVGDLVRIGNVAEIVARQHRRGKKVAVVVSAMSGETDRLLKMGNHFGSAPPARELDALAATGEQTTSALLAIALASKGIGSVSLQGSQVPIRTNATYGNAMIESVAPQRILRHLGEGLAVIVAGFQGVADNGDTTTLGRGGSDLSAVALAAALDAELCDIYTDVAGVFTADPGICSDARPIEKVAYDEMLELASLGAKVLQARSVQLAKRYQVPVHVLSTFEENAPGTWITKEERDMEGTVVSAISLDRKESQISVRRLPDPIHSATKLFTALADSQVVVDVIVQDRNSEDLTNVTFTVPRTDYQKALTVVKQISQGLRDVQIQSHEKVAKVSAVGLGMRSHSGVAAQMFRSLAREKIEVMAVSTSDIKISCVIDDRYAELAVRTLHDEFGLAKEPN
jgi:aspartate kinase